MPEITSAYFIFISSDMKKNSMSKVLFISEQEAPFYSFRELIVNKVIPFIAVHVASLEIFITEIKKNDYDLIVISDISDSLSPQKIKKQLDLGHQQIPVLLILPKEKEGLATKYIPEIADDYVLNTDVNRISFAVTLLAERGTKIKKKESSEKLIKENDKRWKAFFDSETENIFQTLPNGEIIEVNSSGLRLLGLNNQQMGNGKLIFEFLLPEELGSFEKVYKRIALGDTVNFEFSIVGPKKLNIRLNCMGIPLKNAELQVEEILLIARDFTKSRSVIQELNESEKKHRNLISKVPSGIFQTDPHGDFIFVNPFWCALAGLNFKDAMGMGWAKAIHPDDRAIVVNKWFLCMENKIPFQEEFRFLRADGSIIWIFVSSIILMDEQNKIEGYLGTVIDIDVAKHFEEALAESQARLEGAQNIAKVGDWDFDLHTNIGSWSKEMYSLFGRSFEGGPPDYEEFFALIHPEDKKKVSDFQQKVIDTGHGIGEEYRIIRKDGTVKDVYPTAYCMYDADGVPAKIIGTLIDVTERVKSNESIKRKEQLIDSLFSQSLDGMFEMKLDKPIIWNDQVDKDAILEYAFDHCRITKVNEVFLEIHGGTKEQMIGLTPGAYYSQKEREENKVLWQEFYQNGRARNERLFHKRDKTPIWLQGDYICIYDSNGHITGHLGFQKDITRERNTLEELKFSERNFREIFENSPDGIYIEDYNGNILDLNAEACRMQNLPYEELVGKNLSDLTPEEKKEDIVRDFRMFCDGTIDRLQSFSWDKDWNQIPVEIKVNRIVYSGMPAILLHVRDMRVKKITDPDNLDDIKSALKQAEAGKWEWNVITGEIKSIGIIDGLLDYHPGEIKPTLPGWLELLHPDDHSNLNNCLASHLQGETAYSELEYRMKTKSGKYKWLLCRGSISERDQENNPVKVSGIKVALSKKVLAGTQKENKNA